MRNYFLKKSDFIQYIRWSAEHNNVQSTVSRQRGFYANISAITVLELDLWFHVSHGSVKRIKEKCIHPHLELRYLTGKLKDDMKGH